MSNGTILLQFTKEEITELLNINPNEKNKRILEYIEKVFNSQGYSEGRGKNVVFKVVIEANAIGYYDFKLFLLNKYNLKVSFDYNLCLKLIYFLMNNEDLLTLEDVANAISENISNVKYYRNKMLYDLIKPQYNCKQQAFNNLHEEINMELHEQIEITFRSELEKVKNSNSKYDLLEVYYYDNEFCSNYKIVGTNELNYAETVEQLLENGYVLKVKGYLYTNGKINSYMKNAIKKLHLKLFGYEYTYVKSIYTLIPKYLNDNTFKQMIINSYNYFKENY